MLQGLLYPRRTFTLAIAFLITSFVVAQPANNDYSNAIDLSPDLGTCSADAAYTTLNATTDLNSASCWNNSGPRQNVWFKFTAASTGIINITIDRGSGKGNQRRTQLALWESNGTTQIACEVYNFDDEDVDLGALGLTPSSEYYISVDTYNSGYDGSFTICTDTIADYDFFEGAIDITPDLGDCSADAAYTTIGGSPDKSAGTCWNNSGPRYNRWFKFTAPTTGIINITVDRGGVKGSQRRTQIALWEDDGTTQVTCDVYNFDDEDVTLGTVGLTPGDEYYISIDSYNNGYDGSFTICTDTIADYDFFEGAIDITPDLGDCSADAAYTTIGGSPDKSAGSCWNNSGPRYNRWFKFTAPTTEIINITVDRGGSKGSQRRTQIALWEDDGTTQVTCDVYNFDDEDVTLGTVGLTPGDEYYISIDSYNNGYDGSFTICTDTIADYDFFEGAIDITPDLGDCSADAAYTTIGGSPDKSAGSCWNNSGPQYNRWFKFTAPTTGIINITVDRGGIKGSQRRTQIALWENDGTTQVTCDIYNFDDEDVNLGAIGLSPGVEYYISIDTYNNGYDGSFTICTDTIADYDFYEGAIDVTAFIGSCSPDAAYSTIGASSDLFNGSCWNNSGPRYNRWFKFTAPASGMINVTVDRGGTKGSQRRTQIALWEDDGITQVSCDIYNFDDEDVQTGSTSLTTGDTYFISVDTYNNGYDGSFTLCLDDDPGYDFYEGAIDVTSYIGGCTPNALYTTIGGTSDKSIGSCWNNSGPRYNRWFKFTAPATGMINVTVDRGGSKGSQRRTQLALWAVDGITEIECNRYNFDDEDVDLGSSTLTPGVTYYISVDTYNNGYDGSFTLCLEDKTGYDYYEGAIELTDLNNWCSADAEFTTIGGTPDYNAASCWNNSGPRHNRWFKFKAISNNLTVTIDRGGSKGTQRRTQLALWESNGTTQKNCARNSFDNEVVSLSDAALTVGNDYYISVDTYNNGYDGSFTLCIDNIDTEYYSISSGDWDNPSNWSIVSHVGAAAASFPNAGDVAYIQGHRITVDNTQSCAQVRLTVADNNTELLLDGGNLTLQGKLSMINNGNNFDGEINLTNSSTLTINDSLNLIRNGGSNIFSTTIGNNCSVSINQSLGMFSSGGTVNINLLTLNGNSILTINKNLIMGESGGIKNQITANSTSRMTITKNIEFAATTDNRLEIEMNNDSRMNLKGNVNLGIPAYGILDFNDFSTLEFNGTSKQQIPTFDGSGTGDIFDIPRIRINNTFGAPGQLELNDDITINESLTLIDGVIDGLNSYTITIANGASISGDNNGSYIDGVVKFIGNSNHYFPLGDGNIWAPMELRNLTGDIATEFTGQYHFEKFNNTLVSPPLKNISTLEYWDIQNFGTVSTADVRLYWKNAARSEIDDYTDLVIAHYNSGTSIWENLGQNSNTSSNPGSITVNGVATFSPFTFGSLSPTSNPLPVTLKSFVAFPIIDAVMIQWQTVSEINNAYFTIEKSIDGIVYNEIAQIAGNGNSNQPLNYEDLDLSPSIGTSYYRLKQTDFNGESETFNSIAVKFKENTNTHFSVYPNPNSGNELIISLAHLDTQFDIQIVKMDGKMVYQKQSIQLGESTFKINFTEQLATGIYFVQLKSKAGTLVQKLVITANNR